MSRTPSTGVRPFSARRAETSRRAVLRTGAALSIGALGAVALAACDAADSPTGDPAAVATTAPAVDADADLVATTGQAIADTAAVVAGAGKADPALRPLARELDALHRVHLDELGWSGTTTRPPRPAPRRAREVARTAEADLRARLADASLAAGSGGLAQLFASMAAAIAQRETRW